MSSTESASGQEKRCLNCGAVLTGPYCSECGQRDLDFRRDWQGLVGEVVSSFFHLDGKFLQNVFALLFRPGALTQDFLRGRRTSQLPPLRFYLFISIVFFLWQGGQDDATIATGSVDSGVGIEVGFSESEIEEMPAWAQSRLDNADDISQRVVDWLPIAFLFSVPVLALFLRLLFRKATYVYLEYLVMALHAQSFVMLWLVVVDGWAQMVGLVWSAGYEWVQNLSFWAVPYFFLALRKLFAVGWLKAIATTLLLGFAYMFVIAAGIVGVSLLAIWLA